MLEEIQGILSIDPSTLHLMEFAGNTAQAYVIAFLVFVLSITLLKVFKTFVVRRLRSFAEKTATGFDDLAVGLVDAVGWPFYMLLSFYASLQFISVNPFIEELFGYATMLVAAFYLIRVAHKLIDYAVQSAIRRQNGSGDSAIVDLMGKLLKYSLWVVAGAIILSNMGVEISALVAGMGIGGIAIALAVQNILGDIFCSFSIYFDKPFQVGDYIVVGEEMGTVKRIGIKSTRITSLQGEEIIISNRQLVEARIHNFRKMKKRRITFGFGVTYSTPTKKLKKAVQIVKSIMKEEKMAELDLVNFIEFGDSALKFEVIYFVKSNEFKTYREIQQRINFALKDAFEKEGIEMAYPTQTLYVNKAD